MNGHNIRKKTSILKKVFCYLKAARVDGWYIIAVFFLLGEWYSDQSFPIFYSSIGLLAVLGIISTVFWINYVFDKEVDELAGKDISFLNYISQEEMIISSFIVFFISSIILFLIDILAVIFGVLLFILGLLYSVPPVRLKVRPPFDCIVNGLGMGTIPFFIGWSISDQPLNYLSIAIGLIASLAVIDHYFLYTSFDVDSDKEFGIKTSCTKLGFKWSINVGMLLFLCVLFLSIFYLRLSAITIGFIFCIPLILGILFQKDRVYVNMLVGSIFVTWSGVVLFILAISSYSALPIFFFIITVLFASYALIAYSKLTKYHQNNRTK